MRSGLAAGLIIALQVTELQAQAQQASGPLRVHPTNPRYFADAQGRGVYLTGSHTWSNLQDIWMASSPVTFDFNAYLDLLQENNHNFIRMWHAEMPMLLYDGDSEYRHTSPHPWRRTGPGLAGDDEPRFNLDQFNQAYFNRLRQRCIAAGQRGIYVSIMLFEGHALSNTAEGWFSHPFNSDNNINGVDGDLNNNGEGEETHTLAVPSVTAVQAAYVRKVVETVNDLDNVMYEIANESHGQSLEWQEHFINYIKNYQSIWPQQHLVWFTTPLASVDDALWKSSADVISPGNSSANGAYQTNPPVGDGSKIIINDTDHLWGCGGNVGWVWKSFARGLHPIYMDSYYSDSSLCAPPDPAIRAAMGHTRAYALRMNLANCLPSTSLANTGYCLADIGDAYLVYAQNGGTITLNLAGQSGALNVEWLDPDTGSKSGATSVQAGSALNFNPPFAGHAVLFVHRPAPSGGEQGDVTNDGEVDIDDLLQVMTDWGVCPSTPNTCMGDANTDGVVSTDDLLVVLVNWAWTSGYNPGDVNHDGAVNIDDLIQVMSDWGACPGRPFACLGDASGDGVVNTVDLLLVMVNWG